MTTISVSLDKDTKKNIDFLAKKAGKSRSDLLRDIIRWYRLDKQVDTAQTIMQVKFQEYNLKTFEDLEKFLEN
mgnify:CR=1 FL=1